MRSERVRAFSPAAHKPRDARTDDDLYREQIVEHYKRPHNCISLTPTRVISARLPHLGHTRGRGTVAARKRAATFAPARFVRTTGARLDDWSAHPPKQASSTRLNTMPCAVVDNWECPVVGLVPGLVVTAVQPV